MHKAFRGKKNTMKTTLKQKEGRKEGKKEFIQPTYLFFHTTFKEENDTT